MKILRDQFGLEAKEAELRLLAKFAKSRASLLFVLQIGKCRPRFINLANAFRTLTEIPQMGSNKGNRTVRSFMSSEDIKSVDRFKGRFYPDQSRPMEQAVEAVLDGLVEDLSANLYALIDAMHTNKVFIRHGELYDKDARNLESQTNAVLRRIVGVLQRSGVEVEA